jgi:SAM-dependent methyltransferase
VVRVLTRAHAGKGAAVQAGLLDARGATVAFCDVDLATPLPELARIVAVAEQGVLAVGSRGLPTSNLGQRENPVREMLGKAYNRAAQLLVTPGITDTQCGAKAAPRELWQAVLPNVSEQGFAWDVDLIAQALATRQPVVEVPIAWNHQPGSSLRVTRDGARMLAALPRINRRARRARSSSRSGAPAPATPSGAAALGGVFDAENAETLAAADAEHWWFRSRAAFVNFALGRYAPRGDGWLVDVGAGSAGVTARLAWDRRRVAAVEGNAQLARQARAVHHIMAIRADASAVPVRPGVAGVVCLLDVIEHVTEPAELLRASGELLARDGVCVVTVPAHPRLWSPADDVLGHQRRYTRRSLRAELEAAGLRVEYVGHVFSWLVLPVWFRRRVARPESPELGLDASSGAIDAAALVLTAVERAVLRFVSLPIGTSVLAVARRAESSTRA